MLDGEYNRFSRAAGLRRMDERIEVVGYRAGRKARVAESRTEKPITEITEKRIQSVKFVQCPGMSESMCQELQKLHKELLRESKEKNGQNEVAYIFSNDLQRKLTVYGSGSEIEFPHASFGKGQFLLHNHPRNHSFSMTDIATFISNDNLSVMTVVKHNGGVELLTKSKKYDKVQVANDLNRKIKKIKQKTDENLDKMLVKFLTDASEKDMIVWVKK